jgi:hypothetical protein
MENNIALGYVSMPEELLKLNIELAVLSASYIEVIEEKRKRMAEHRDILMQEEVIFEKLKEKTMAI